MESYIGFILLSIFSGSIILFTIFISYVLCIYPCIQKKKALKDLENGRCNTIDEFLSKYPSDIINDKEIRSYFQLNQAPCVSPAIPNIPNINNIKQSYQYTRLENPITGNLSDPINMYV